MGTFPCPASSLSSSTYGHNLLNTMSKTSESMRKPMSPLSSHLSPASYYSNSSSIPMSVSNNHNDNDNDNVEVNFDPVPSPSGSTIRSPFVYKKKNSRFDSQCPRMIESTSVFDPHPKPTHPHYSNISPCFYSENINN